MKIKLDNLDRDDGLVLVMADWKDAELDQSIEGSMWEHDGDFAYAYISDHSDLINSLRKQGYDLDLLEDYCEPDDEIDYYAYSPGDGPYD